MKIKWYISTLLVVFTLLVALQENVYQPNQEIVLQFNDVKVNAEEVEKTILEVTERLYNSGATNIKINETENGTLKISYYSTIDVSNIKEILSEKNELLATNSSSKKDEDKIPIKELSNYNFNVFELDNHTDVLGNDNNSILELKFDVQRFTTNKNYASLDCNSINKANQDFKTAEKARKKLAFVENNTSHRKPEVRAGPFTLSI